MARPSGIVTVAPAWAAGTLWVQHLPNAPGLAHLLALALGSLVAVRRLGWRWPFWLLAGALWTSAHVQWRLTERLPDHLSGTDVSVTGWVDAFPRVGSDQVAFSFRVRDSDVAGVPERLRLTWYQPPAVVRPAAALELTVRLKPPRGLVNPGGFDYERWLFQEGYGATGYVRIGRALAGGDRDFGRRWLALRARLGERIRRAALTDDASALLVALTLGERSGFDDAHWRTLRRTGTSHLVAISGLHVGLVAGMVFLAIRRLVLRLPAALAVRDLEVAALASFATATGYAALAGFTVPTQRALIMLAVGLLALVRRRRVAMTGGLSTALLLVLMWDPMAPLSASFWLSFIAVTLLWRLGRGEREERSPPHRLFALARVQWGISLGLIPVVAWFFHEVSVVAPLVNLLAIPLFSVLLVPAALVSALVASLHPQAEVLVAIAGAGAQRAYDLLAAVGEWPWAAVTVAAPTLGTFVLACLGVAGALASLPVAARFLGWLALLPIFITEPVRPQDGDFDVEILDVGHGLAVLVQTRRHTLVYDAGPRHRSGFDAGAEVVLPALRAAGWPSVDVLLISHADNDHSGGAPAVARAFPDARILAGPDVTLPDALVCERGQEWVWDGVSFRVLHPDPGFPWRGNDSSCVLRVSSPAGSLLLTGDIEAAGERRLVAAPVDLAADVVVVPHHGSATSSSAALVAGAGAAHAVVSAAHGNQWGFPRPEVVRRWQESGARIVSTGEVGAIRVSVERASGVRLEGRRNLNRRYWSAEYVEPQ